MARFILFLGLLFAVLSVGTYFLFFSIPPLPKLDEQAWWGPDELKAKQDDSVRPFQIKFKPQMIQDLKKYLNVTRKFVPPLEGVAFEYGFNSNVLDGWLHYWAQEYPFEEREKFLNKFPSYKTMIQGLNIHFIHVRPEVPKGVEIVPMLLLHVWPGSVREFYESIPLLTAVESGRDFAIEVIIPSLPGYGWSDAPVRPGMGAVEIAVVMRNLMQRLGFKKYYVQGGDWGSAIGNPIATFYPQEVLGYHTNFALVSSPVATFIELVLSIYPTLVLEPELADRMYPLSKRFGYFLQETGYMHMHCTKPDTIGVALSNSPAGLLVYILEKFSTWTDRNLISTKDGGLTKHFSKEQLVDNLMVYWSTQSITTSMRLYSEFFNKRQYEMQLDCIPTQVPTWALQPKYAWGYQPPFLVRLKYPNLLNASALPYGGHFLALELPEIFSKDVIKAVEGFREWHSKNNKSEL